MFPCGDAPGVTGSESPPRPMSRTIEHQHMVALIPVEIGLVVRVMPPARRSVILSEGRRR
jgi:hypothetical protein